MPCEYLEINETVFKLIYYIFNVTIKGDSGAPVAIKRNDNSLLIGLVSFGGGCSVNMYDVHSRVTHFYSWIREVANLS